MKMKKLVLILVGIILISFSVGFLSLNLNNRHLSTSSIDSINLFINKNQKYSEGPNVNEEKIIKMEGIDNIDIESHLGNLNIISEDRKDIKIHYHGNVSENKMPIFKANKKGKRIMISADTSKNNFNNIKNSNLTLDIYIPKNYKNNMKGIIYAGNIIASDLELDSLNLTSYAGNISLDNILASNIKTSTNAGNIKIDLDKLNGNLFANTSAGNIKLALPENSNFSLDASVSVGNIKSDFPIDDKDEYNTKGTIGNGENKVKLKTSAGNLSIKSK